MPISITQKDYVKNYHDAAFFFIASANNIAVHTATIQQ